MDLKLLAIKQAIEQDHFGSRKLQNKFGISDYMARKYILLLKQGKDLVAKRKADELDHHNIKTVFEQEPTIRYCKSCGKLIYKKFQIEIDKTTKKILSRICIWDEWYTCCGDCESHRWRGGE